MRVRKVSAFHEPCHLARFVIGECVTCGAVANPLHMPMKYNGWYDAGCCPVCNGTAPSISRGQTESGRSKTENLKHVSKSDCATSKGNLR
jgi:hypothetical protein